MWKCVKCAESSEDTFDSCWNCGTTRDGRPAENQAEYEATRAELLARDVPLRPWPATSVWSFALGNASVLIEVVSKVHPRGLAALPFLVLLAICSLWYSESKRRLRRRSIFHRIGGYILFWIGGFTLAYAFASIACRLSVGSDAGFAANSPSTGILWAMILGSACALGLAYGLVFEVSNRSLFIGRHS